MYNLDLRKEDVLNWISVTSCMYQAQIKIKPKGEFSWIQTLQEITLNETRDSSERSRQTEPEALTY